jgi:hypothetical protein
VVADISVRGAEKLAILARALREAGDKELQRELYRGLNRAVKPLRQDVKESIGDFLPQRYARVLARDLKVTARRRTGGRNPALYLLGQAKNRDIASLNRGRLRHPLYGNRRFWYSQRVRRDWWTHPLIRGAPEVRRELERTLDDLAKKIARRVS